MIMADSACCEADEYNTSANQLVPIGKDPLFAGGCITELSVSPSMDMIAILLSTLKLVIVRLDGGKVWMKDWRKNALSESKTSSKAHLAWRPDGSFNTHCKA